MHVIRIESSTRRLLKQRSGNDVMGSELGDSDLPGQAGRSGEQEGLRREEGFRGGQSQRGGKVREVGRRGREGGMVVTPTM